MADSMPASENGATHYLVVTLDPVPEKDRAEYDAAPADERGDWDSDRRQYTVECAGLTQACHGWIECQKPHDDLTQDVEDEGEGVLHGVYHQRFHFGWAVETGQCSLYAFPDSWCDSGYELANELGEGRHPIDFDWDDEYVTLLSAAKPSTPPAPLCRQCGPGYRLGDDGCRHIKPSTSPGRLGGGTDG